MESKKISQSINHLKVFVAQREIGMPAEKQLYSCVVSEENIIGQADVLSPMLSQFSPAPTRLQEIVEKTAESLPRGFNRISILALLDSMDMRTGFLSDSLAEISATYNHLFSSTEGEHRLNEVDLERDRRFIRDHGAILGLLSANKQELKSCFSNHLAEHAFSRKIEAHNKKLAGIQSWVASESKKTNQNLFLQLKVLSSQLIKKTSGRALSITMTRRILGCDCRSAAVLCQAYHSLPESAFSGYFRSY